MKKIKFTSKSCTEMMIYNKEKNEPDKAIKSTSERPLEENMLLSCL